MGGSLLREMRAAAMAIGALDTLVVFVYWVVTGNSPWPLILVEAITFGPAVALVSLTSPASRNRQ